MHKRRRIRIEKKKSKHTSDYCEFNSLNFTVLLMAAQDKLYKEFREQRTWGSRMEKLKTVVDLAQVSTENPMRDDHKSVVTMQKIPGKEC